MMKPIDKIYFRLNAYVVRATELEAFLLSLLLGPARQVAKHLQTF